jgi:hypothetical protein
MSGNVRTQPLEIDLRGDQNTGCIRIFRQREQQMLDADCRMPLLARQPLRPRQTVREVRRRPDRPEAIRDRRSHTASSSPALERID